MEKSFKLPDVGEGVAEAELVEWLVKVGDMVAEDQIIAVVTTDKANVEIPTPYPGRVTWIAGEPGDALAIGSEIARIDDLKAAEAKDETAARPSPAPLGQADNASARSKPARPAPVSTGRVMAAPAVRARAEALGIDLAALKGTGAAGQITHADLDKAAATLAPSSPKTAPFVPARSDLPVNKSRLSSMRRAISAKMNQAKPGVPHFTYVEEVDVTEVEAIRAKMNADADSADKLSILPFIMRAVIKAVAETPYVNALYDPEKQEVHLYDEIRLGLAVATDKGLMVPVISNAQGLNLSDCAQAIRQAAEGAREGTATRAELVGSTLTLTSLGALGGIVSTPVINPPEVAIVGVNKVRTAPVWNGETFEPRQVMNLSCSFDHRIIDGAVAARFVAAIKQRLETCDI